MHNVKLGRKPYIKDNHIFLPFAEDASSDTRINIRQKFSTDELLNKYLITIEICPPEIPEPHKCPSPPSPDPAWGTVGTFYHGTNYDYYNQYYRNGYQKCFK